MLKYFSIPQLLFFGLTFWFVYYRLTEKLRPLSIILAVLVVVGLGLLFSPLLEPIFGPLSISDRMLFIGFFLFLTCIQVQFSGNKSTAERKVMLLKGAIIAILFMLELYGSYLITGHTLSK